MKNRDINLDIIRSLAIFMILFHHLPQYYFNFYDLRYFNINVDLSTISALMRYFGLGLFTFCSGYLLTQRYSKFENGDDIRKFLQKRYARIFPLYILALIIFVVGSGNFNVFSFIVHVLGLQSLFCSKVCVPIFTLWYVGLIVVYYHLFVIMNKFCSDLFEYITFGFIVIVILFTLNKYLGIIDRRLIVYFPTFLAGMLMAKTGILNKLKNRHILISVITWIFIMIFYIAIVRNISKQDISLYYILYLVTINLIMVNFTIIVFYYSKLMHMSRLSKFFQQVSYASFCIYLFHRPVWHVMKLIYQSNNKIIYGAYLILIGISMIICLSYFLQKTYDVQFYNKLVKK